MKKFSCKALVCAYTSTNVHFFETDWLLYAPIILLFTTQVCVNINGLPE